MKFKFWQERPTWGFVICLLIGIVLGDYITPKILDHYSYKPGWEAEVWYRPTEEGFVESPSPPEEAERAYRDTILISVDSIPFVADQDSTLYILEGLFQ